MSDDHDHLGEYDDDYPGAEFYEAHIVYDPYADPDRTTEAICRARTNRMALRGEDIVIVRGIDPGERVGWCDLEVSGGTTTYLAGGSVGDIDVWTSASAWRGRTLVAVEMPGSLHPAAFAQGKGGPARIVATVQGLIRAARVGQQIIDAAASAGVRVVEVDAAEARRGLGVKIGGNRRGPPCGACSGSGADVSGGSAARVLIAEAAALVAANARHERGARTRRDRLAIIRHDAVNHFPCDLCDGSGEQRPPTVDQQVAALLPTLIEGWPKRSCVHSRDAAVAALKAIRDGGGRG